MKTLSFSTILAALCVTILTSALSSVSAQTNKTFDGPQPLDTRDEYVPGSGQGGLDFASMMHNASLTNSRSMGQFRKEQDENMTDQVEKFRNRQPLQIEGIGGKVEATPPEAIDAAPPSKEVIKTP
jgi:hypothetical protein